MYLISIFLVATKKLSSELESVHFLTFSANCRKFKIGERDGHGKIFCQVCGNPVITIQGSEILVIIQIMKNNILRHLCLWHHECD